jgi:hypothetical protein
MLLGDRVGVFRIRMYHAGVRSQTCRLPIAGVLKVHLGQADADTSAG